MDTIKIFRRLTVLLFAIGALTLLWKWNYVPQGVFIASWAPERESPFIYDWGPLSSLSYVDEKAILKVSGDRATFKIKAPFDFSKMEVSVRYEEPETEEIFLGGLSGPWSSPDRKQILYSRLLEKLDWNFKSENGLSLWERTLSGRSLQELESGKYPLETVGMLIPKNLAGGAARDKTYFVSLRGGHTFWILPGGGGARMVFKIQNMNRNLGPDPIVIEAWGGGKIVKKTVLEADEEQGTDPSEVKTVDFFIPSYKGSLQIRFLATDDIFIREISTNASRMVLEGRIFLGDNIGYGGKAAVPLLWTNSPSITARTPHREGRQTINFAGRELKLETSGDNFYLRLQSAPGGILPMRLAREDADINVSGFISLAPEDFFNPAWPEIYWDSGTPKGGTILAPYQLASRDGRVLTSKAVFWAKDLYKEADGGYRLFFDILGSAPKELKIKSISIKAFR